MTRRPGIDWSAVQLQLERAQAGIDQALAPNAKEGGGILRQRAAALAAPGSVEEDDDGLELVEFTLAHETYAIESAFVREICPLTDYTPLPCTPSFVLGIMNLRGEIISILDIRQFFDLPSKGLTDLNKVVVVRSGEMTFGVLVDAVLGVRRTKRTEIQPSLPTLTGIREKYLEGVTRDRKVVLDGAKLIGDEGIIVRQYVDR